MKRRRVSELGDLEKFFEYARCRDERPSLQPMKYSFDPVRKPDMMLPRRPQQGLRAAESALSEIREFAGKARELYRGRRMVGRPLEAREYVRHQLQLGMLDVPSSRLTGIEGRFDEASKTDKSSPSHDEDVKFRFLRRRARRG